MQSTFVKNASHLCMRVCVCELVEWQRSVKWVT